MKRALIAATVYFLALFALGFILGTMRVLFVAPSIGVLRASLAEVLMVRWNRCHSQKYIPVGIYFDFPYRKVCCQALF